MLPYHTLSIAVVMKGVQKNIVTSPTTTSTQPNFIYIFGVEGCWVPVFVETSVSGIHKPEWFYTLLRQVKIWPFIMWSLSD